MLGRTISRFWLRRLCEGALFASGSVLVLYAWARFIPTGYRLPVGEAVSDLAAAAAALASLITFILCLWLPRWRPTLIALGVYLLLSLTIGILITTSGGLASPFVSVWMLLAVFAGLFGWQIVLLLTMGVVLAVILANPDGFSVQRTLSWLLFGVMPLVLGLILWHRQPKTNTSYSDLANKLTTVEGKSDVVINTIDDGVLAISRSGIIELINPSAQALIGWQSGDALGLSWQSVLKLVDSEGREVPEADHPVAQALISNRPTHSDQFAILTSSEKRRLVSIVSSPVGQPADGVIVVFRDITKEKAEEREQAEFISTASHEMRTPVASIEGYLGLALNPATAQIDEKARDFITKAHESAQHLGRLFQDLLDISKAEDGRLKSNPSVINVTEFVGTIFDSLAPAAAEKQLLYVFRPRGEEGDSSPKTVQPIFYAFADADHFREIITNLIENAIKYTASGQVVVDVVGDAKLVTISVKDSGIGIPAEDVPHLFQKFYRVDNSDTREIGGTGLGLYLSRRLAESMSGVLRVSSEYKKGSTFFLDMPRLESEEARRRLEQAVEPPTTPPTDSPAPVAAVDTGPQPEPEPPAPAAVATPAPTIAQLEQQLGADQRRITITVPDRK